MKSPRQTERNSVRAESFWITLLLVVIAFCVLSIVRDLR